MSTPTPTEKLLFEMIREFNYIYVIDLDAGSLESQSKEQIVTMMKKFLDKQFQAFCKEELSDEHFAALKTLQSFRYHVLTSIYHLTAAPDDEYRVYRTIASNKRIPLTLNKRIHEMMDLERTQILSTGVRVSYHPDVFGCASD